MGIGAPQSPRPRWGRAVRPVAAGELAPGWGLLWSSGRALGRAPRCFNPCQCLTSLARPGGEVGCAAQLLPDGSSDAGLGAGKAGQIYRAPAATAPADARVTLALPRCPGSSGQQPPWPREVPMRAPAAASPAPAPAWVWPLLSGEKFSVHPWERFPS